MKDKYTRSAGGYLPTGIGDIFYNSALVASAVGQNPDFFLWLGSPFG